ncbi:uncharacterized protein SCHCODRAFT_02745347 [Schizophyllum commune H4-8]|nr:uncharacterized protein SCHCODRAFT_02745347 [Schizophyllum commune H4-8]KAI5896346.1 hypothetical protein SCHCODRAFT_02745347 [Schizophyllum commune H4-8]
MNTPPDLDSRPAKRARTEDESEPVVCCEELWYDDGNLVLQAERTQFRVHRSILCKQSIVFRDMKEASCTSAAGSANVDGCPVVELQDSAEAIRYMLRCMYDTGILERPPTNTEILLALRMGHKYLISTLFEYAASYMHRLFPSHLADYEADGSLFSSADRDPFEFLAIARSTGLETVIPALCLSYLRDLDPGDLAKSVKDHTLSPEDGFMLLFARNKILDCTLLYCFKWALDQHRHPRCVSVAACDQECLVFRDRVSDETYLEAAIDLEHGFLAPWDDLALQVKLCPACKRKAERMHEEGRGKFWKDLPSFFGLKPWEELHDFAIE